MPFTQRRVESAPAHSKHAWDRTQVLCHAAAVQNSLTAGLHCCFYTLIAFHSEARRVGISPQQPCLRQIISAVPCCCCAKPPFSRTALLHLHLCRLPFTLRRFELASAHSNQAWEGLYLLCDSAAVQDSPSAGLHCCIYTYADCLSPRGASSQHQPTASMPETDCICCAMLLLCKTALQLDCTAAFTPMQIAFYTAALRVGISPQQACLGQNTTALSCCCCAKQPYSTIALLHLHLCLSHKGALSQHQPTASMPGTENNCSVMLLLCKTALQHDCTAAFTPMQIAFHTQAHRVSTSPQQPCLKEIISAVPCCCCAKPPFSRTAPLHLHLCLSHKGASSQHQPTASMPGTEHKCSVMLLLCKTASQLDCTAAFTP